MSDDGSALLENLETLAACYSLCSSEFYILVAPELSNIHQWHTITVYIQMLSLWQSLLFTNGEDYRPNKTITCSSWLLGCAQTLLIDSRSQKCMTITDRKCCYKAVSLIWRTLFLHTPFRDIQIPHIYHTSRWPSRAHTLALENRNWLDMLCGHLSQPQIVSTNDIKARKSRVASSVTFSFLWHPASRFLPTVDGMWKATERERKRKFSTRDLIWGHMAWNWVSLCVSVYLII